MRHTLVRTLAGLIGLAMALALGCANDVPVGTLCEGLTLQVDEQQTSRDPVKLDFLWVIDDSSSMSQEQTALASSISVFTETLAAFANVDIRTAVVTTYYESDERRGRFNTTWVDNFPRLAQASEVFPVLTADEDGDRLCECAACQGFDETRAYLICRDNPEVCTPDESTVPVFLECWNNGFCANQDDCAGRYIAEVPSFGAHTYNLNLSINSRCHFVCGDSSTPQADADLSCQNCLQNGDMTCQISTSDDPSNTGCMVLPDTDDCPADLPAVLPSYNEDGTVKYSIADYFRCLATPGALMDQGANLEQGLRQAWAALSPDGPHPDQICDPNDPVMSEPGLTALERRERCERAFLRDNAYLVVIFMSDEEDCSLEEGKTIGGGDYAECGLLGDADTPDDFRGLVAIRQGDISLDTSTMERPLATVAKYANRLKALKDNPANVFVAAIVGDVWSADGEMTAQERADAHDLYYESLTQKTNSYRANSYICASEFGIAFYGSRYIELAEMFGPHGFTANICSDEGIGPTLSSVAAELISEVISICLPRPVQKNEDDEELVTVYKTVAETGEKITLEQGVDFNVVDEPEEGACPGSSRAIRFESHALPLPEDTIEIIYEAEAKCML